MQLPLGDVRTRANFQGPLRVPVQRYNRAHPHFNQSMGQAGSTTNLLACANLPAIAAHLGSALHKPGYLYKLGYREYRVRLIRFSATRPMESHFNLGHLWLKKES